MFSTISKVFEMIWNDIFMGNVLNPPLHSNMMLQIFGSYKLKQSFVDL
jgi:hypothetical protein